MEDIKSLLETELPEALQGLETSHVDLQRLAQYGRDKHAEAKDKGEVTQEMKEYLTQSLEAVASEVAIFSHTFLRLLDSQADLLDQLTSCGTQIAFDISMKKEQMARRQLGAMTMDKEFTVRPPMSLRKDAGPLGSQYFRRSIDYSILDDVGFNVKREGGSLPPNDIPVTSQWSSTQSINSISSIISQREQTSAKVSTKIGSLKLKQLNKAPIPVSVPSIPASGTSKEEKPAERAEDTTFVSNTSSAHESLPDPVLHFPADDDQDQCDEAELPLPPPPLSPPGYLPSDVEIKKDPVISAPGNWRPYDGKGDDDEELPPPPPSPGCLEDAGKEDWELELERAIAMLED